MPGYLDCSCSDHDLTGPEITTLQAGGAVAGVTTKRVRWWWEVARALSRNTPCDDTATKRVAGQARRVVRVTSDTYSDARHVVIHR